ncbi:hypothetical protein PTKIN_Ptkin14bG0231000 [Pterospermum kingtungense]
MSSSLPPEDQSQEEGKAEGEYLYSAVLLRDAGVKFKLDEFTESFFRNLMAWEQRYYSNDSNICDYIFLMQYLITSTEDVDLLVRRRIIINQLGSNKAVVDLSNNFCKHIIRPVEKNSYADIFRWRGVATIAAAVLLVLSLIQTICSVISLL